MISVIIGFIVALLVSFIGTPILIRVVDKLHYGQFIRQDGPQSHLTKRGTPTMGGVVIILSIFLGWLTSALYRFIRFGTPFSRAAILVLFAMISMGVLGFIDDFSKVAKKQNEGLTVGGKLVGQVFFASMYAFLSLVLPARNGLQIAHAGISGIGDYIFDFNILGRILASILFILWVNFLIIAWTNAVNLTDGLDGLATGSSMISFVGFTLIALWEAYHIRGIAHEGFTYDVSDPLDLAIIAVCAVAACFGFLWYNTNPAKIFMGDTGSLALGGLFAALSIATHTEILSVILGALFVVEAMSDIIQVSHFKRTGKRVFKMAPIHHHFELMGWPETQVVVRFWMMELMCVLFALIIFYGSWIGLSGLS